MTKEAEKEFHTEIAMNLQKEEAFFNLGLLYFQEKDYPDAIKSWDSTVAINPKNADAYNNLGASCLNFKNDNASALVYFEKSLELNPDNTQGCINILVCAQNTHNEGLLVKYINMLVKKGMSIADIKAKGITVSDELLKKINSAQ